MARCKFVSDAMEVAPPQAIATNNVSSVIGFFNAIR
jgi:hypothetical protein